jgi:chromosome segregation ATPase
VTAFCIATVTAALSQTFKCVDDKGVTLYGDTMPPQCATKQVTEMSGQGRVRKNYERPLTAEEIKAREEEKVRKKEEEKLAAEQKRKDSALLATYGSEREIDITRDRSLGQIDARVSSANQRIKEIDKRVEKLQNEMEFYKAGKSKKSPAKEPPIQLVNDLERAGNERTALEASIKKMEEEKVTMREKFDKDKARWKELKAAQAQLRKQ